MTRLGRWLKYWGLGLGIGVASALTTTAPAIAGSLRIDGTGFSLQFGNHPIPYHVPIYPKYIHPPYYYHYHPPLSHTAVPYYYYSHPVTPSITITPKGTTIILPFSVIQRSTTRFYYYGF